MRIVFGRDEDVARWAGRQLRKPLGGLADYFVPPYVAIGIEDNNGKPVGAYVLNVFTGFDIEVSMVGRGAVCRDAFHAVANYVFNDCNCIRMSATIRADDAKLIDMMKRGGWVSEGVTRRLYGNADGIRLGLLKDEYYGRWRKSTPSSKPE